MFASHRIEFSPPLWTTLPRRQIQIDLVQPQEGPQAPPPVQGPPPPPKIDPGPSLIDLEALVQEWSPQGKKPKTWKPAAELPRTIVRIVHDGLHWSCPIIEAKKTTPPPQPHPVKVEAPAPAPPPAATKGRKKKYMVEVMQHGPRVPAPVVEAAPRPRRTPCDICGRRSGGCVRVEAYRGGGHRCADRTACRRARRRYGLLPMRHDEAAPPPDQADPPTPLISASEAVPQPETPCRD